MALEFTKLSDVEVVAELTESANVLIEEDGVIKKVLKDKIGSGEKPDMVIRTSCRTNYSSTETTLDPSNVTIVEGSLDLVIDAIRNGRVPVVVVETYHVPDIDYTFHVEKANAYVYAYSGSYRIAYTYNLTTVIYINMDDTGTIVSVVAKS